MRQLLIVQDANGLALELLAIEQVIKIEHGITRFVDLRDRLGQAIVAERAVLIFNGALIKRCWNRQGAGDWLS